MKAAVVLWFMVCDVMRFFVRTRRRWAEEAGSAGRSRRSRCRRCSLRTWRRGRCRRSGSRRCRDAPVGAPPEGNAKEVTRCRRRVTTAASRDDGVVAHGSLPAAWSDSGYGGRTVAMVTARADLREMWMRADLHAG